MIMSVLSSIDTFLVIINAK